MNVPGFECLDCGRCTLEMGEYFMVLDEVWEEAAGKRDGRGMLCLGCLELRIGRTLAPADFSEARCNWEPPIDARSGRMMDRLGLA